MLSLFRAEFFDGALLLLLLLLLFVATDDASSSDALLSFASRCRRKWCLLLRLMLLPAPLPLLASPLGCDGESLWSFSVVWMVFRARRASACFLVGE